MRLLLELRIRCGESLSTLAAQLCDVEPHFGYAQGTIIIIRLARNLFSRQRETGGTGVDAESVTNEAKGSERGPVRMAVGGEKARQSNDTGTILPGKVCQSKYRHTNQDTVSHWHE